MKSKKINILIYSITFLLFVSLLALNFRSNEFQLLIANINESREEFISNSKPTDLTKYAINYADENTIFTDAESKILTTITQSEGRIITYEKAKEDIDYAFNLLKYCYGAYEYFGGDTVFNKVKEDILKQLIDESIILPDTISKYLYSGLESIITDGHFRVNGKSINENKDIITAFSKDYYFKKENDRYYTLIDDEKYYLENIDGDNNIDNVMRPSIDESGNLVYVIGVNININDEEITQELTLINKDAEKIKKEIGISKNTISNKYTNVAYEEHLIDGIPVLDINSMFPKNNNDDSLNQFVESASKFSNESVIIIDLRGNVGGSLNYSQEWMESYLGNESTSTHSVIRKISKTNLIGDINMYESLENIQPYEEILLKEYKHRLSNGNYGIWYKYSSEEEFKHNDNLIFVLIDKEVASAGEGFVDYLRYVENVIFVGGNTKGCSLVLDLKGYQLPNSKVTMNFGNGVNMVAEGENLDAIGFQPDIWVDSKDSLNRTIALIKNYNLDKK